MLAIYNFEPTSKKFNEAIFKLKGDAKGKNYRKVNKKSYPILLSSAEL